MNICVKSAWFYSFCTRFKTHEKHPRCTSVHIWALFNSSIQSFLPISRLSSSLSLGKYLSVCSCSASSCQEPVRGGSSPFRLQCNERLLPEGGMDRSQNCCITEQLLFFFFCSKVLQSNAQRYLSYMLLFFFSQISFHPLNALRRGYSDREYFLNQTLCTKTGQRQPKRTSATCTLDFSPASMWKNVFSLAMSNVSPLEWSQCPYNYHPSRI